MKAKQKINPRIEARQKVMDDLSNTLKSLSVIDDNFKQFIRGQWYSTVSRLNRIEEENKFKKWGEIPTEELFQEWKEVEKQINMLKIFSSDFKQIFYGYWFTLIQTYNPYSFKNKK